MRDAFERRHPHETRHRLRLVVASFVRGRDVGKNPPHSDCGYRRNRFPAPGPTMVGPMGSDIVDCVDVKTHKRKSCDFPIRASRSRACPRSEKAPRILGCRHGLLCSHREAIGSPNRCSGCANERRKYEAEGCPHGHRSRCHPQGTRYRSRASPRRRRDPGWPGSPRRHDRPARNSRPGGSPREAQPRRKEGHPYLLHLLSAAEHLRRIWACALGGYGGRRYTDNLTGRIPPGGPRISRLGY